MSNFRVLAGSIVAAMTCLSVGTQVAHSQDFPSKPVRIIVANSPGTSPDIVARIVSPELSKILGQPVIVENKPGAGQVVGLEYVAKQPADGYTIASVQVESLVALPVTVKDLRFDPLRDLVPVIGVGEARLVVGSSSKESWATFQEFVANAKKNPGKLNYGSSSAVTRLSTEALLRGAGLDLVHIPYGPGAAFVQGLVAGDVQLGFVAESGAASFGDRFRVLAVSGTKRSPRFPDAPTFAELGLKEIPGLSFSFSVAAGTPAPIMDKLRSAISQALQQSDVKAQFAKAGYEIIELPPNVAAQQQADMARLFADIAAKSGIRPE